MISALEVGRLKPEEKRLHDLDHFIFNRVGLLGQNLEQAHQTLLAKGFDYTLNEVTQSDQRLKERNK